MGTLFDRFDLAAVFILAVTLTIVVWLGSESFSAAALIFCTVMAASALAIGRAVLSLLSDQAMGFRRPAEIVVGIAGLSISTWLGSTVLGVAAGKAFMASCGLAVAAV